MITFRTLVLSGLAAASLSAFAAAPVEQTTRDERMAAALKDYEARQGMQSESTRDSMPMHHHFKKHQSHVKHTPQRSDAESTK